MNKIDVRSSTYNPKLANYHKKQELMSLFSSFTREVNSCIERLWPLDDVPGFLPKAMTDQIQVPSARWAQVIGKQASSVVRSIKAKKIKALNAKNPKKYQLEIMKDTKCPEWQGCIELDSRFIDIKKSTNSMDYWIKIHVPKLISLHIPMKLTKHQKDLLNRGFELQSNHVRLRRTGELDIFFEKSPDYQGVKRNIGIDIGRNKCLVTSEDRRESVHQTGHFVHEILAKIQRQTTGSVANKKTREELKNQIKFSCKNDVNWSEISTIYIENIKNMKSGKVQTKSSAAWSYPMIRASLEMNALERGVRVQAVSPAYTSQICSNCGHIHADSREGEEYSCIACGFEIDADLNAAINILRRGEYSPSRRKSVIYENI